MEKVMVVPTELLEKHLTNKSFITEEIPHIIDIIMENHQYVSREYAEYASEYKQIIPYAVLASNAGYFLTKRLKTQTEKRLHGMYSIGLGGHINPQEESQGDVIIAGMRRELSEEVGLEDFQVCSCAGIINDHAADVSNYHIGLLYPLIVDENIRVQEISKMTGKWASQKEIDGLFDEMESWSQIAWENRQAWERRNGSFVAF